MFPVSNRSRITVASIRGPAILAIATVDDFWSSSYITDQLKIELCEKEMTLSYALIEELSKKDQPLDAFSSSYKVEYFRSQINILEPDQDQMNELCANLEQKNR